MEGVAIMPSGAVDSVDGRPNLVNNNHIDNGGFIGRSFNRISDAHEGQAGNVQARQIHFQRHSPDAAAGGCIHVVNAPDRMLNPNEPVAGVAEANDDSEMLIEGESGAAPDVDDDGSDQDVLVIAAAAASAGSSTEPLRPYPFYNYVDRSTEEDPDPLSPVTPPGRVPNFPAKMHAILAREDFSDVVCWMPHGRAWKIVKPREFELNIVPLYFEHAKFSSFVRQANGWDFRRFTKGPDRNCYYNPYFLRGLPYLCKKLKRPGIAKKLAADPDHEPDLYKISDIHPIPERYTDDSVLLHCVLQGGPKARMPIYTGFLSPNSAKLEDFRRPQHQNESKPAAVASSPPLPPSGTVANVPYDYPNLTPHDQEAIESFQRSLEAEASNKQNTRTPSVSDVASALQTALPSLISASARIPKPPPPSHPTPSSLLTSLSLPSTGSTSGLLSALALANQLAFQSSIANSVATPITVAPQRSPAPQLAGLSSMLSSQFPSLQSPFPSVPSTYQAQYHQSAMPNRTAAAMPAHLIPQSAPDHFSSLYQAAASSHFAAGFAAATALNDQNFQQMMASFSASLSTAGQRAPPHYQQQPPR